MIMWKIFLSYGGRLISNATSVIISTKSTNGYDLNLFTFCRVVKKNSTLLLVMWLSLCFVCHSPHSFQNHLDFSTSSKAWLLPRQTRAALTLSFFFFFSLVCMWWRAQAPLNLNFQKFSFPSSFSLIVLSGYWLAWIDWYFRVAEPRYTWLSRMCNIWCSYQLQRARYTLKLRGKKGTKNKPPSSTSLLALVCVCARRAL